MKGLPLLITSEEYRIDEHATLTNSNFNIDDGWHKVSINIPLPKERTRHASKEQAPHMEVKGVWHRRLLDVIIAAYRNKSVHQLISTHYEFLFQEGNKSPERVYTEGYTCDALLEEDANIQAQSCHADNGLDIEYSMVPLMLWSDSTHLANFGTALLWPIYLYFGNLSKYLQCKPSHFAAYHIAYIPLVSSFCISYSVTDELIMVHLASGYHSRCISKYIWASGDKEHTPLLQDANHACSMAPSNRRQIYGSICSRYTC